jgi:hypothetical protein
MSIRLVILELRHGQTIGQINMAKVTGVFLKLFIMNAQRIVLQQHSQCACIPAVTRTARNLEDMRYTEES